MSWLQKHPMLALVVVSGPAIALMVASVWVGATEPQTYIGLLIAYLTMVLIAVTGFYACITRKTLRVTQDDLEARMRVEVYTRLSARTSAAAGSAAYLQISNLSASGVWVDSILAVATYSGVKSPSIDERVQVLVPGYTTKEIRCDQLILRAFGATGHAADKFLGPVAITTRYRAHGKWAETQAEQHTVIVGRDGIYQIDAQREEEEEDF